MKKLIVLANLLWAGMAGAGEISPAPPPTQTSVSYPKSLYEGKNCAEQWAIYDNNIIQSDYTPDCQRPQQVNNCPWRIKVVPESEAEKLMNEGWGWVDAVEKEYVDWGPKECFVRDRAGNITGYQQTGMHRRGIFIYLKKRVCK